MDENLSNTFYAAMKSLEVKAAFEPLIKYVNKLEERTDKAETKLREYSKDEEIQKLQAEIDRLNRNSLLVLSDKELEAYNKLTKGHNTVKVKLEYTEIGTGIDVKVKGEWKDITDFNRW